MEELSTPTEDHFGDLCSPSEIGKNLKVCINVCQKYQCCFDAKAQCDKSTLQCDYHSICAELIVRSVGQNENEPYLQYSAVDLAKACNSKQLAEDPEGCRSMCKGSTCKFSSLSKDNTLPENLISLFQAVSTHILQATALKSKNHFAMIMLYVRVCSIYRKVVENTRSP